MSDIFLQLSGDFLKLVILSFLLSWPVSYFLLNSWLENFAYRVPLGFTPFVLAGVVCLIYRELDQVCPGSRFILTERGDDSWLRSIRGHLHPKSKATRMDSQIPLQRFVRARMFNGHLWFEEAFADDYLQAYRGHSRAVKEYFRGRDNLLVMDVEKGDGWETLCDFLGVDIPETPFPWKNRRTWWRSLRRMVKFWKRRLGLGG